MASIMLPSARPVLLFNFVRMREVEDRAAGGDDLPEPQDERVSADFA